MPLDLTDYDTSARQAIRTSLERATKANALA